MRTSLPVAIGVVAVVALTGCSGDSKDKASSSASSAASAARSAAAAKTTEADGSMGAIKQLEKQSCTADKDGKWSFKGHLTNTQKTKQNFVVSASVVDSKTFTVMGRKDIKATLEPGKSQDVKADAFYTKKGGVQCVLRVTRKAA